MERFFCLFRQFVFPKFPWRHFNALGRSPEGGAFESGERLSAGNLEERRKLDIYASVGKLESIILAKDPGEGIFYKTFARAVRSERGLEWRDPQGKIIPDIIAYLAERERGSPICQSAEDMRRNTEEFWTHSERERAKSEKNLQEITDPKISLLSLQQNFDYTKMASLFLDPYQAERGFKFTVDFKGNARLEVYLGLGQLLPPSVTKVLIIDLYGKSRIGYRNANGRNGKVGYYDETGYIPVFSGYSVEVLETVDEKSLQCHQSVIGEQKFQEDWKRLAQNESWKEETLDEFLQSASEGARRYQEDWNRILEILFAASVKIDPDTLLLDAEELRNFQGKASVMLDQSTVQLIQRFAANGYEFRLADLHTLHRLARQPQELEKLHGTFEEVLKFARQQEQQERALSLDEVRNHSRYQRRVAENGLLFRTPDDFVFGYFRHRPKAVIGDINLNRYADGTYLGRLQCARYVSDVFGLTKKTGWTVSASSLFSSLVRSGGELVPDSKGIRPGDILFQRGTFDNLWNTISHVSIVIDRDDSDPKHPRILRRHYTGMSVRTAWQDLSEESCDGKIFEKKFYAAVRHPDILAKWRGF